MVQLDGETMLEGKLAAFMGGSLRGVQADVTSIPNLALAGEFAGKRAWSLSMQGNPADTGKIVRFEYTRDEQNAVRLETTLT